ncbi:hypothetical protein V8C42DRAFT_332903 [Trichoderma barbatum]
MNRMLEHLLRALTVVVVTVLGQPNRTSKDLEQSKATRHEQKGKNKNKKEKSTGYYQPTAIPLASIIIQVLTMLVQQRSLTPPDVGTCT